MLSKISNTCPFTGGGLEKTPILKYEVCPKSSWTSLVEVLDKHISLKAFAFHEVQHQLNIWSKFHEN